MLKSSEFNSAVPKFTNGNYASNPLDPTNIEEPSAQDYVRGTEPLDTLPAQWWNWLCNQFTSRFNKLNTYVKNIFDELTGFLSLLNISPDGTESAITTGQLKNAFKEDYPSYINDKLELGTTYVKRTQKVNNHALSGDITISKSDVGLGNVANTGDSATPVSGGTTKFTTGGAYTELAKKQDKLTFDSTPTSGSFNPVISEGIYNALSNLGELKIDNTKTDANLCIPSGNNKEALFCMTNGTNLPPEIESWRIVLLRCECIFKTNSFIGYTQTLITNGNSMYIRYSGGNTTSWGSWKKLQSQSITTLAFSTSTSYSVGEYCIYNDTFYRCTVAHSAGAWNASHFTDVTVGGELETKANQTDLAVPTDAVLHYSFDEVPDYPDGTADVRLLNNNTYDIQSTDYRFLLNTFSTSANDNGKLKVSTNTNVSNQWFVYMSTQPLNKIVKIRFTITNIDSNTNVNIRNGYDSIIGVFDTVGTYEIAFVSSSTSQYPSIYFYVNGGLVTLVFDAIYIGDGSYSTPIIDNANGRNNATNNGGIAVKGVSGKGAYFLEGKYANIGTDFQLNANFSISLWVKPDNNTLGLNSNIISRDNQFILRNGASWGDYLMIYLYGKDSFLLSSAKIGSLLTPNVWTNVIITRNELTCKCYINGINVKTFTLADNTISQSTKPLYICGNSRPQSIDDFLIFNRALSETEVMALYLNKANTPKYYGEVPVTRKVNGYTLDKDITLAKSDIGLSNVVNTGDSATPVSGGITKFTTGGAYSFFGGNTNSKTWLTKLFSRTIGNSWTDSLDLTTSGTQFASAYGKGVWVVASQRGTFWSENLTSWTAITGVGAEGSSINFKDGVFVLGTRNAGVWWSENGKSFTLATGISGSLSVTTTHVGEIWLASTNTNAWWSNDGKSWTTCVGTSNGINIGAIDYGSGKYFAGKKNEGLITSNDGKTWSSVSDSIFNDYTMAVKYTNGIWLIGTYRHNYNKNLITSKDDGSTWYEENITVNGYVSDIWTVGNNAIVTWSGSNSQTQIITLGINEENSCIIHHESIDYTISTFIEIFGTYFAFTFPGQLMRSTNLLVWENTFAKAESSSLNTFIFAENKLLYTSQIDGAQFSEIDLNAV